MTELSVVRSAREAAILRHPAGKAMGPRFVCVICDGPTGDCDCVEQLLDGKQRPLSEVDVRRIVAEELDKRLDKMADDALAVLRGQS